MSGHTNAKQKIHVLSKQSKEINELNQKLLVAVREKEEARNEAKRLKDVMRELDLGVPFSWASSKENRSPGDDAAVAKPSVPWIDKALGTTNAVRPRRLSRDTLIGMCEDEGSVESSKMKEQDI